jgi:hypothetical protein
VTERDWKTFPDDPARVQHCAGVLLQAMGTNAVSTVREWVKLGDRDGITHMGIGAPYRAILAALETPGARPERVPRQPSWSDSLTRIDDMRPKQGVA